MPLKKIFKIKTKNRNIKTSIPAPGTEKILKKLKSIESRSMHGQLPIVWKKAKNFNRFTKHKMMNLDCILKKVEIIN